MLKKVISEHLTGIDGLVEMHWGRSIRPKYPSTALLSIHKSVQEQTPTSGHSPAEWVCGCSLCLSHVSSDTDGLHRSLKCYNRSLLFPKLLSLTPVGAVDDHCL